MRKRRVWVIIAWVIEMSAKTNAVRMVEKAGIAYEEKFYDYEESDLSGTHAAQVLGIPEEQVFKTLVARGAKTGINVFCIPVCCELDLKKAAKAALLKHVSSKRFVPKIFKDSNHIDEIKGVYVPFWLFDTDSFADVDFTATRTRSWSDSNYDYLETSYFKVKRSGNVSFLNVPVDGSTKMPDDLMESIEPFNFNEAVDFQTAYLSGYLADKYDVDDKQSIQRANARIKKSTEQAFEKTVKGYASVSVSSSSVRLSNGKVRYALFPVWILNTSCNGENYVFAMNGQTGKLVGDLPADKKKINLARVLLSLGYTALAMLIMFFLNT